MRYKNTFEACVGRRARSGKIPKRIGTKELLEKPKAPPSNFLALIGSSGGVSGCREPATRQERSLPDLGPV
jgi:hypothetical protein